MAILSKPTDTSAHWYYPNGTPCHTVLDAKGNVRNTHLGDARKLGLFPSVTGVLDVKHREGLVRWKEEQCAKAALLTPPTPDESDRHWMGRVRSAAFEQVDDAKTLGGRIHKAIEAHDSGGEWDQSLAIYVSPVFGWQAEKGLKFTALEKVVVSKRCGVAGTMDKAFTWGRGKAGALDYKSKKTTPGKKVEHSFEYGMQLAAYIAFEFGEDALDDALAANVIISTTEPGRMEIVTHRNPRQLYRAFLACNTIWQIENDYFPGEEK